MSPFVSRELCLLISGKNLPAKKGLSNSVLSRTCQKQPKTLELNRCYRMVEQTQCWDKFTQKRQCCSLLFWQFPDMPLHTLHAPTQEGSVLSRCLKKTSIKYSIKLKFTTGKMTSTISVCCTSNRAEPAGQEWQLLTPLKFQHFGAYSCYIDFKLALYWGACGGRSDPLQIFVMFSFYLTGRKKKQLDDSVFSPHITESVNSEISPLPLTIAGWGLFFYRLPIPIRD